MKDEKFSGFLTNRCTMAAFLCVTTTLGFFTLLATVFFVTVPENSKDILQIMLGVVGGQWTAIVGYFYGSSAGSARKTDMLTDMASPGDSVVKSTATMKTETTKTVTTDPPKEKP